MLDFETECWIIFPLWTNGRIAAQFWRILFSINSAKSKISLIVFVSGAHKTRAKSILYGSRSRASTFLLRSNSTIIRNSLFQSDYEVFWPLIVLREDISFTWENSIYGSLKVYKSSRFQAGQYSILSPETHTWPWGNIRRQQLILRQPDVCL